MSYMVSVDGGSAPTVEHPTLELAKAEAERLSEQSKNRYQKIRVLQVIDVLEPRHTHAWRGEE